MIIEEALARFGLSAIRPAQARVIEAGIARENLLAIMPTGAGKSLCYQLPSLMEGGVTIVISPLLALMRDQLAKLKTLGIPAFHVSSAQSDEENHTDISSLRQARRGLFYISPEQLAKGSMQMILQGMPVTRLVVDEAHCFSSWGHEFRPDYRAIPEFIKLHPAIRVSAFTATATMQVVDDLKDNLFEGRECAAFISPPRRDNIDIRFLKKNKPRAQLLEAVRNEPTIVYVATRNKAEVLAQALRAHGLHAEYYHAGLENEERRAREAAFLKGATPIIVATNAFGMGVDHAGIRHVIHADQPASIEAYVQEIGRAGRDGEPARALCLYSDEDAQIREEQILTSIPDAHRRAQQLKLLHAFNLLAQNGGTWDDIDAYFADQADEKVDLMALDSTPILALKRWRYARAQRAKVPPYFILPDDLLERVAKAQPSSLEELGCVAGIGDARLQNYGTEMLEALGFKVQALKRASRQVAVRGQGDLFLRLQDCARDLRFGESGSEKPLDISAKLIARIIERNPATLQDFAQINGMDAERVARFAERFLLELSSENR